MQLTFVRPPPPANMLMPYSGKRILPFYGRQSSQTTTVHSLTPKPCLFKTWSMNNVLKISFDLIYMAIYGHIWASFHGPSCVCALANCLWVGGWPHWVTRLGFCVFVHLCICCVCEVADCGWMGGPTGSPFGQAMDCKVLQGNVRRGLLSFLRPASIFVNDCFNF